MNQTVHEQFTLPEGNGVVTLSANEPHQLREMLCEIREEVRKAIIRVEDEQAARAWETTQEET